MSDPRSPQPSLRETAAYQPGEADPPTQLRPEEAATLPPAPLVPGSWPGGLPTQLPARLGRYELRKLLGKGGMGAVYLAQDLSLDRPVALKIPFFAPQESQGMRERFLREAKAAGMLSHPNLCPVYDVGEINGVHYLSMAYIEGQTLAHRLRSEPRLGQRAAAELVRTVALALQEAHDRGIIHRDLKPANIMINQRGQPIIMDFGLARQTVSEEESRLTKSGTILGTPAYMPPEQINADLKAMGPGCDIYSLGIILYEVLTGHLPFNGPLGTLMANILMDPPPLPSLSRPDLDPSLEMICLKALAKAPQDRFPSMAAFAAALTDFLNDQTVQITSPVWPVRATTAPPLVVPAVATDATQVASSTTPVPVPPPRTGMGCGRFLLGCGLILALIVGIVMAGAVLIVYKFAPEINSFAQRARQDGQDWEILAEEWEPPAADAPLDVLFPAQFHGYTLQKHETVEGVDDLGLKVHGWRAVYRHSRGEMELFLFRVTEQEKEKLYTQAQAKLHPDRKEKGAVVNFPEENKKHFRAIDGTPQQRWLSYGFSPPLQHGFFWWDEDWLFLVRSSTIATPEQFLKGLLQQYGKKTTTKEKPTRSRNRATKTK